VVLRPLRFMVHVGSQLTAIHDLDQARLRPVELIESMTPPSTTSYNMTWSLIQSPLDNSMIVSICIEELNARATFDVALLAVVWSRQEAPRTKLFGARGVTEEDIYATIAHALQRLVAMLIMVYWYVLTTLLTLSFRSFQPSKTKVFCYKHFQNADPSCRVFLRFFLRDNFGHSERFVSKFWSQILR
jgi:hypothetical protein